MSQNHDFGSSCWYLGPGADTGSPDQSEQYWNEGKLLIYIGEILSVACNLYDPQQTKMK